MKISGVFGLLVTCSLVLLSGCGSGGGGGAGVTATTQPVPKSYKQQILGLLRGQYQMNCRSALVATATTTRQTLTIDDSGKVQYGGKAALDFSQQAAVFSINPVYVQHSPENLVAPGMYMLGKTGDVSIGIAYAPASGAHQYKLKTFYYQNDPSLILDTCEPIDDAQTISSDSAALALSLTTGLSGSVSCAGVSTPYSFVGSQLKIGSRTIDMAGAKFYDLFQAPADQEHPLTVEEGNFKYTASLLNGTVVSFSRLLLRGTTSIMLSDAATKVTIFDCQ